MSKIVTMAPQVEWVSAEDMYGRVQDAVSGLEKEGLMADPGVFLAHNEVALGSGNGRVRIREGKAGAVFVFDNGYNKAVNLLMNELVLMEIKEQAARNRYRVTIKRLEEEKVSVLLER